MGALSISQDYLFNPQVRALSGSIPGTSRYNDVENRSPTGDRSLNDPDPKSEFSACRFRKPIALDRKEASHMVTGVQEETPSCSPGISSGKQKKVRSASKPQSLSGNTPATIEADQILLAFEQLASNCNSANFKNNNIKNRISKLPKSLTTKMPTFDGNQKKLNCLKICSKPVSKFTISSQNDTE